MSSAADQSREPVRRTEREAKPKIVTRLTCAGWAPWVAIASIGSLAITDAVLSIASLYVAVNLTPLVTTVKS